MTKNKRIANELGTFVLNLNRLAVSVEVIRNILLEKESVPAGPLVKTGMEWSTKQNKWVPVMSPTLPPKNSVWEASGQNKQSSNQTDLCTPKDRRTNWKDEMTAEINKRNSQMVVEAIEADKTPTNTEEIKSSSYLRKIAQNSKTTFYKRIKGMNRGSLLTVDRRSHQITDHKYLVTKRSDDQLALVSKDEDGLWYVNNVIRPSLRKRFGNNRIVRYYRNGNQNGRPCDGVPYTHSAVYQSPRWR